MTIPGMDSRIRTLAEGQARAAQLIAEQQAKHDGNLSSGKEYASVRYCKSIELSGENAGIRIEGQYADDYYGHCKLTVKEALSLLDWLLQERETLEQLATTEQAV